MRTFLELFRREMSESRGISFARILLSCKDPSGNAFSGTMIPIFLYFEMASWYAFETDWLRAWGGANEFGSVIPSVPFIVILCSTLPSSASPDAPELTSI